MKTYNMGETDQSNAASAITCVCVVGIVALFIYVLYKGIHFYWPFLFISVGLIVIIAISWHRASMQDEALQGSKKIGKITGVYKEKSNSSKLIGCFTYFVEYTYKNGQGEECTSRVKITADDFSFFHEGMEIPIYVNGEFSMFKIDEVKEYITNKEKEKKELERKLANKNYICPYCGTHLKENEDHCPNCGANKSFL